jgi:hypothetical protein
VLVTKCFRLEQKSYLPLQFMSGFGKTTIFNGLIRQSPKRFLLGQLLPNLEQLLVARIRY